MRIPYFTFIYLTALLTALLIGTSPVPALAGQAPESSCGIPVIRVVDGDTIVVSLAGKTEKIRLLNVDTPESVHPDKRRNTPMGKAASDFTRSRLAGKHICLEFEGKKRGKYGRLLAYVIEDGQNINLELVRLGWSPYYTKYGTSPRYHSQFTAAMDEARAAGRGIWANRPSTPPKKTGERLRLSSRAPKDVPGPFRGNTQSRVFHRPDCRWYACSHCTRTFTTRTQAEASGYRPCSLCQP